MIHEQLHAYLLTNPGLSFSELTTDQQVLMGTHLRSGPEGFTGLQINWLADFYLVVKSQEDFDLILAKLPSGLSLTTRKTIGGLLVLSADLLTDSLRPDDTYPIGGDLAQLEIRFIPPDEFPLADETIL